MKNLFLSLVALLVTQSAFAENNGLAVDANKRGFTFSFTDVGIGSTGITMSKPGVVIGVKDLLRDGRKLQVVVSTPLDTSALRDQFTFLCNYMFGSEYRLNNYDISVQSYAYLPESDGKSYITSLGCLFTQKNDTLTGR